MQTNNYIQINEVKLRKWLLWNAEKINSYEYNQAFTNESNFGFK